MNYCPCTAQGLYMDRTGLLDETINALGTARVHFNYDRVSSIGFLQHSIRLNRQTVWEFDGLNPVVRELAGMSNYQQVFMEYYAVCSPRYSDRFHAKVPNALLR